MFEKNLFILALKKILKNRKNIEYHWFETVSDSAYEIYTLRVRIKKENI